MSLKKNFLDDGKIVSPRRKEMGREKEIMNVYADEEIEKPQEILN